MGRENYRYVVQVNPSNPEQAYIEDMVSRQSILDVCPPHAIFADRAIANRVCDILNAPTDAASRLIAIGMLHVRDHSVSENKVCRECKGAYPCPTAKILSK